jgi:L-amino acid N-acyltransferase
LKQVEHGVMSLTVRNANLADVPAILEIYNDVIATSTAVYTSEPRSLEDRLDWFKDRVAKGFPVLAAYHGDTLVGFATYGEWRGSWAGYFYTVEHSIHIAAGFRGQGIGNSLMRALIERAKAQGKHVMLGGVDASNEQSLKFHRGLGFEPVSHFKEVGRKFDRWLDLVFVQKLLDPAGSDRP